MSDSEQPPTLNAWEIRVLRGVIEAGVDDRVHYGYSDELRSVGWITSGRLSVHLRSESFATRKSLRRLADSGFLDRTYRDDVEYFRISANGRGELKPLHEFDMESDNNIGGEPSLTSEQIRNVLKILSEVEDLSEETNDNLQRAQISGFVRALEILIQLPQVPRQGILYLLRDPAFANIVQLGTFLAAIVAAVK